MGNKLFTSFILFCCLCGAVISFSLGHRVGLDSSLGKPILDPPVGSYHVHTCNLTLEDSNQGENPNVYIHDCILSSQKGYGYYRFSAAMDYKNQTPVKVYTPAMVLKFKEHNGKKYIVSVDLSKGDLSE